VLALYTKAKLVPAWALLLLMLSKRVHSIFVLRMFNDSVAALLMYTAILFFVNRRWTLGSRKSQKLDCIYITQTSQ
jgi:alpha-1,3-mannosyltransferase